jgi:hypothetical protein
VGMCLVPASCRPTEVVRPSAFPLHASFVASLRPSVAKPRVAFRPCRFSRLRRLAPRTWCRLVASCSRSWGSPGFCPPRARSPTAQGGPEQAPVHQRCGPARPAASTARRSALQPPPDPPRCLCLQRTGPCRQGRRDTSAAAVQRADRPATEVTRQGCPMHRPRRSCLRRDRFRPSQAATQAPQSEVGSNSQLPTCSRAIPSGAVALRSVPLAHSRSRSPWPVSLSSSHLRAVGTPSPPCGFFVALSARLRRPQGFAPCTSPLRSADLSRPRARCSLGLLVFLS